MDAFVLVAASEKYGLNTAGVLPGRIVLRARPGKYEPYVTHEMYYPRDGGVNYSHGHYIQDFKAAVEDFYERCALHQTKPVLPEQLDQVRAEIGDTHVS